MYVLPPPSVSAMCMYLIVLNSFSQVKALRELGVLRFIVAVGQVYTNEVCMTAVQCPYLACLILHLTTQIRNLLKLFSCLLLFG